MLLLLDDCVVLCVVDWWCNEESRVNWRDGGVPLHMYPLFLVDGFVAGIGLIDVHGVMIRLCWIGCHL
jgi:hypothetical protein